MSSSRTTGRQSGVAEVVLEVEDEVQEHRVERTVHGKGRSQSTAEGGDTEQRQVEQRVVGSELHRHERNQEHDGESKADSDPGVAPGDFPSANQSVDQADQPGGEGGEPGPVRPSRMWRLGLIHLPPGDDKRGHSRRAG